MELMMIIGTIIDCISSLKRLAKSVFWNKDWAVGTLQRLFTDAISVVIV